jgi:N-formylglutamate amidohydrolase
MGISKTKLLFTCPHGGKEELDILRDSNKEPPSCTDEFIINRELKTQELTYSICKNIEAMNGEPPHTVLASHHRKFVDFNREELCAFDEASVQARDAYTAYHDDISFKINQMFSQNEKGLAFLFDIHGFDEHAQDGVSFDVIIGNDQGRSIQALNNLHPKAYWGNNGLIPLLKNKGLSVLPRNLQERMDGHSLDGGYTIQKYGSRQEVHQGLVAVQIEVVSNIRSDDSRREKFASQLAECIYNFVSPFILRET